MAHTDNDKENEKRRLWDPLHVKECIMDLISQEKRKLAIELLDLYFPRAETIADFDTLGYLAQKTEHRDMYLKCAEAAYSKAETPEQKYIARSNLYKAYNAMNYPEKALFYVDLNLSITPDDFETLSQKAFNISLTGDRKTAEDLLQDLSDKHPDRAKDLRSAFSGKMLREGRTAEGIVSFLDTFKPKSRLFQEILKMKKWEGTIQPGRKIYIEGEGGIGDEIINIRFFKNLEEYGMEPILYSSWSKYRVDIVDLFRRHGYKVITESYSIDTNGLWAPMMSIPGYLGLTEKDLWNGTYLHSLRNPKNELHKTDKFRIGIKCSGNPYFAQDEYRKIPFDLMMQYLPKDAEIFYIDSNKDKQYEGVINLNNRITCWEDTLDFIDQMDVIISSCTSLVHAAGAMGKRTMVIVPIAEYYIWTSTRIDNTTPWYADHVSVYKQSVVRSWHEPLQEMSDNLKKIMRKQ